MSQNYCTLWKEMSICGGSLTFCCFDLFHSQLENVIQKRIKPDIPNIPPHVVHNQTAAMLEIGTNLLTHTAEQTRKLNVVEAKVTVF